VLGGRRVKGGRDRGNSCRTSKEEKKKSNNTKNKPNKTPKKKKKKKKRNNQTHTGGGGGGGGGGGVSARKAIMGQRVSEVTTATAVCPKDRRMAWGIKGQSPGRGMSVEKKKSGGNPTEMGGNLGVKNMAAKQKNEQ